MKADMTCITAHVPVYFKEYVQVHAALLGMSVSQFMAISAGAFCEWLSGNDQIFDQLRQDLMPINSNLSAPHP